jgi:leucyl-tRNA synthetase
MFAPIMPHLAEECWAVLGHATLAAVSPWPVADTQLAAADTILIPVQVNGKRRGEIEVDRESDEGTVRARALELDAVQRLIEGRNVKKVIVVPQRIVNVVV